MDLCIDMRLSDTRLWKANQFQTQGRFVFHENTALEILKLNKYDTFPTIW